MTMTGTTGSDIDVLLDDYIKNRKVVTDKKLTDLESHIYGENTANTDVSIPEVYGNDSLNNSINLNSEQAKQQGVNIPSNWQIKINSSPEGTTNNSYISPEGKEYQADDLFVTEKGDWLSVSDTKSYLNSLPKSDRMTALSERLGYDNPEALYQSGRDTNYDDILASLDVSEDFQNEFLSSLYKNGRDTETDTMLQTLFPELKDTSKLDEFWNETSKLPWVQNPFSKESEEQWKSSPWYAKYTPLAAFTGASILFPKTSEAVANTLEKYTNRPFIGSILQDTAWVGTKLGDLTKRPELFEADRTFQKKSDELYNQYGLGYLFTDEFGKAIEEYRNTMTGAGKGAVTLAEWTSNPVYLIPIGSTAGVAARLTTKVPVLGKTMAAIAKGAQYAEKTAAYPISKPVELAAKAAGKVAGKVANAAAGYIAKNSKKIITLDMLPKNKAEFNAFINESLVDNWQKKAIQAASKLPGMRKVTENALGYRILLNKVSEEIENTIGKAEVGHNDLVSMGRNLANVEFQRLGAVEMNPKGLFEFADNAFSQKMSDRLLPEYAGEKNIAGTLEHVFTNPEKYNLEGLGRKIKYTGADGKVYEDWSGRVYITWVNEINTEITALLKKNGILPENVMEDWIHRVVQETKSKQKIANTTTKRIGAEQSFQKGRKFKTMAEGITWFAEHPEVGYQYSANIEKSVVEYINQAFTSIANKRVAEYLEEFGIKPVDRLVETRPELFTKIDVPEGKIPAKDLIEYNGQYYKPNSAIVSEQVTKVKKFQDLIDQAIDGRTKFSKRLLNNLIKAYPEYGERFKNLANMATPSPEEVKQYIDNVKTSLDTLQANQVKYSAEISRLKTELNEAMAKTGATSEEIKSIQKKYDQALADAIKNHAEEIKNLRMQLTRQKPVETKSEVKKPVIENENGEIQVEKPDPEAYKKYPTRLKLEEGIRAMPEDVRSKFRSALDVSMEDAAKAAESELMELKSLEESLVNDQIANVGITTGTTKTGGVRKTKLIDWIRWKFGNNSELPESFTKGEAAVIKGVFDPKFEFNYKWPDHMLNKEGRVKAEYIWDEWEEYFGMDYDQLHEHINNLFSKKTQLNDLRILSRMANDTYDEYKVIADILDGVDQEAAKNPNPAMDSVYAQDWQPVDVPLEKEITAESVADTIASGKQATPEVKSPETEVPKPEITSQNRMEWLDSINPDLKKDIGFRDDLDYKYSTNRGHDGIVIGTKGLSENDIRLVVLHEIGHDVEREEGTNYLQVTDWRLRREVDATAWAINNARKFGVDPSNARKIFNVAVMDIIDGNERYLNITLDEASKLANQRKSQGLLDLQVEVKPQIEGIPELSDPTTMRLPKAPTFPSQAEEAQRINNLKALKNDVSGLVIGLQEQKIRAQQVYSAAKEQIKQLGEGFLPVPFANGKIYSQEFIDSFNKFFGIEKGNGVMKITSDTSGIMRLLKASLDVSVMLAQGQPSWGLAHSYLFVNPKIGAKLMGSWYKAFAYNIGSFISPELISQYISRNKSIMEQIVGLGGNVRTVDYFDALAANNGIATFAGKTLDKIPLKPYKRAEMAFFAGGQVIRTEFFKALFPVAVKSGSERELVRLLDRMTGIYDSVAAGVPLTTRQIEQTVGWFAPNYTRACLTMMGEFFRGGFTGKMVRNSVLGMLGAGASFIFAANYAKALLESDNDNQAMERALASMGVKTDSITGETTWQPDRAFMSIKSEDTYYGIGGFWTGLMKLAGNIYETATDDPTFDTNKFDLISLVKNKKMNKDNPFIYWWYSRSAPFFSTVNDLYNNTNFLGYPISTDSDGNAMDWAWENPKQFAQYALTKITPIWTNSFSAMNPNSPQNLVTPAGIAFSMLGGNINLPTYYDKFNQLADKIIQQQPETFFNNQQIAAWKQNQLHFTQLSKEQQTQLYKNYPDLQESYENFDNDRMAKNSTTAVQYKKRLNKITESYSENLKNFTNSLQTGNMTMEDYREKVSNEGELYARSIDTLNQDPSYADYVEYLDSQPDNIRYGYQDDLALAEYQAQIGNADDLYDPLTDTYDYQKREDRIDAFIEKWGQDVYNGIQTYLADKKYQKGVPGLVVWKSQVNDVLNRAYWRLPYAPYSDMTIQDIEDGLMPNNMIAIWEQYRTLDTSEEKETFKILYPDFARDYRVEYRAANSDTDAALAFWSYGGKVQTLEAYNQVQSYCKTFGVSMESLELGLPPQSLIQNYFEYNTIVAKYGGTSHEAKQYRIDNPAWDKWGQENNGWKPVYLTPEVDRVASMAAQGRAIQEMQKELSEGNK